jgi:energy-coupling factor transporter ATP-binding protein EcfA2
VTPVARYDEPFAWWGPGWPAPAPRGIDDLLRDETIDSWTAANLWARLARRHSLVVVAGASGMGKTTLLTALLAFLRPDTRRVYVRGCFESFGFLSDPTMNPHETALLINEISPHLPVYLWGPAVERTLEAAQRGFQLLATAHADSVLDFVGALTGSPLHIPAAETAALELVVVLARDVDKPSGRHVRGIWRLEPSRDGVVFTTLPAQGGAASDISHEMPLRPSWFPSPELANRQQILEDLRHRRIEHIPLARSFADTDARDMEP